MSPNATALSSRPPATLLAPCGLNNVHSGNLDDDCAGDDYEDGAVASGRRKVLRSMFDRYRHFLAEKNELEVPSSLRGLLDRLIVGARTAALLFAITSRDIITKSITTSRTLIAFLEQLLHAR